MRYHHNSILAFCLFSLTASILVAANVKPAMPQYTSVRHLAENVTLASLDNGLTVIVQENHTAPVATVRCYVKNTGSAFEGRYLGAGLSHVLEHVVAGGTTVHHSEKEIENIIARFGGVTNAYTTNDHTTFFIDCPARNAMTAVELIADAMQHITFEPKEFARELKVVRRELANDEVDRGHVMGDMLDLTVYAVHPARHPVIGYLQVLNGTTNQAIIDFYHERYVPNNQIFVVVGDVPRGGCAGPRGAALGHAPRTGDVRRPARGTGAGLAAGGGPRDGGHGLRLRHCLAHRLALATRHVRPGPGGLHPRPG